VASLGQDLPAPYAMSSSSLALASTPYPLQVNITCWKYVVYGLEREQQPFLPFGAAEPAGCSGSVKPADFELRKVCAWALEIQR